MLQVSKLRLFLFEMKSFLLELSLIAVSLVFLLGYPSIPVLDWEFIKVLVGMKCIKFTKELTLHLK